MNIPQAVGRFLRSIRESQSLTQDQVAHLTRGRPWQLSRSVISAIERGRNLPSLEAMIAMSRVLHLDPTEIIERAERMMEPPLDLGDLSREEQERRADELFWAGDFRMALAVYDAMFDRLEQDPELEPARRVYLRARYELRRSAALRRCGSLLAARTAAERVIATAGEHPELQAEGYMVLSALYRQLDNPPLALDAAARAAELSERCDDKIQGRAWLQKGGALFHAGRHEEALSAFLSARDKASGTGDDAHASHIEGNIGMCYLELGRPREARSRVTHAIQMARKQATPALEASWLVELGRIVMQEGDLEGADRYAVAALRLARPREHWLTVFRAEWLRHRVTRECHPADPDRHRIAFLKKLLQRLERHEGDPTLREFRDYVLGSSVGDEGNEP